MVRGSAGVESGARGALKDYFIPRTFTMVAPALTNTTWLVHSKARVLHAYPSSLPLLHSFGLSPFRLYPPFARWRQSHRRTLSACRSRSVLPWLRARSHDPSLPPIRDHATTLEYNRVILLPVVTFTGCLFTVWLRPLLLPLPLFTAF